MKFIAAFLIICGFMFSSCKRSHEKAPEIKAEKTENVNEEVSQIIRNQIDQFKEDSLLIVDSDTLATGSWISVFFTKNNFQPVWTNTAMTQPTILLTEKSARISVMEIDCIWIGKHEFQNA